MNKNILFSGPFGGRRLRRATSRPKVSDEESQLRIKVIGHIRLCGAALRKRISGQTLPGKSHLKQKEKKNSNAPRAALGHFRWAPFFLYCQQIKSFRPTARTPALISFIKVFTRSLFGKIRCFLNRKTFIVPSKLWLPRCYTKDYDTLLLWNCQGSIDF